MRISCVLAFLFFCLLLSCQKKSVPVKGDRSKDSTVWIKINKYGDSTLINLKRDTTPFPDLRIFETFLQTNIPDSVPVRTSHKLKIDNDFIELDTLCQNVYKANAYKPFWADTAKCRHIIRVLSDAKFDGLNPKDYGMPLLGDLFITCFEENIAKNDSLFWMLELSITKNYLKYLQHLRFGKTNPETIFKDWDYKRDSHLPHSSSQFSELHARNPDTLVNEMRPQYPLYNVLRGVLYRTDTIAQKSYTWDPIPYIGKDLKKGDTSWVIEKVRHRLQSVGLNNADTTGNIFSEDLFQALKYFQEHVGISPNGKIDKTTIFKLNFNLEEIESVVRVNMERCRWLPKGELPDYYIMVNIADYFLRIYKNDKEVYKTKVVVGATNKETPMFHSKMSYIEFNPYWTAPVSISKGEILPRLKTDPEFLSRNNMELMLGDSVVTITDFSPYSKNNFPFSIRQKPGEDNSLGVVKFIFPNPYFVFFHDTPSKSYFERDVRAFSHGCVRIYKPLDLAAFLLADQGFTPKQISDIVKSQKNTVIGLKNRVPVYITYWTCATDAQNQVYFFKDIYGRDKLILKELNK